jgi:hypothetical protein
MVKPRGGTARVNEEVCVDEIDRDSPLTKRAHAFDFVSCGLAILSHRGRGRVRTLDLRLRHHRRHESTSPLVGEDTQAARGEADRLAEVGEG